METSQPEAPQRLVISHALAGQRIDRVVADWRGLSRSAVLRLLDSGGLACNGRPLSRKDKGSLVHRGDTIELAGRLAAGESPMPDTGLPLEVLAEGPGWLVVNKPAGVAVRPHAIDETGTVLNAVVARWPAVVGVGEGGLRSGVVHRLDTDTSGALLVAVQEQAWQALREAFAEHRIKKQYEAIVAGSPPDIGEAKLYLRVAQHAPARVEASEAHLPDTDARRCSLAWRVIERFGDRACRVEVDLQTGFLHQVRVMMSHLGWPIIGDAVYGGAAIDAPRQMLHARSLEYEAVSAEAPLPADYLRVVDELRSGA